jgi:hypothetical protein
VKRFQSEQNAFDHAHPGLVNCEATVDALLAQSHISMQNGGQAISQLRVDEEYAGTAVPRVYPHFYKALLAYVSRHGPADNNAITEVTGEYQGHANELQNRCLAALATRSSPPSSYPTPAAQATGPPGCPGSAALLAAWHAAPASAFQAQSIAPGLQVSGFNNISCWHGWIVADPIANANGSVVFGSSGGLHLLSSTERRQFNNAVCATASAPAAWKSPAAGPASCSVGP